MISFCFLIAGRTRYLQILVRYQPVRHLKIPVRYLKLQVRYLKIQVRYLKILVRYLPGYPQHQGSWDQRGKVPRQRSLEVSCQYIEAPRDNFKEEPLLQVLRVLPCLMTRRSASRSWRGLDVWLDSLHRIRVPLRCGKCDIQATLQQLGASRGQLRRSSRCGHRTGNAEGKGKPCWTFVRHLWLPPLS